MNKGKKGLAQIIGGLYKKVVEHGILGPPCEWGYMTPSCRIKFIVS